jgi:hypothetical protein
MEPVIAVTSPLELLLYGVTQHPRVALKQCSISAPTLILKHLVGQPILAAAAFQAALFARGRLGFRRKRRSPQGSPFPRVNAIRLEAWCSGRSFAYRRAMVTAASSPVGSGTWTICSWSELENVATWPPLTEIA